MFKEYFEKVNHEKKSADNNKCVKNYQASYVLSIKVSYAGSNYYLLNTYKKLSQARTNVKSIKVGTKTYM